MGVPGARRGPDDASGRIGFGRTAEVEAFGSGRIIKLLRADLPEMLGQREAAIARLVTDAEIPAPRFHGVERRDGRFGLVYERPDGPSMLDRLSARPWSVDDLARQFADLHVRMHRADGSMLPDQRGNLRAAVDRASKDLGRTRVLAVEARLERLPIGSALCHGDFHPGNVILTATGPAAIDWLTAGSGRAEADVARTLFLLTGSAVPDVYSRFQRVLIGALRRRFAATYLVAYRRGRTIDVGELAAWRLPILAARVAEAIDVEIPDLLASIDGEIRSESSAHPGRSAARYHPGP